jgi:hypothetical protein
MLSKNDFNVIKQILDSGIASGLMKFWDEILEPKFVEIDRRFTEIDRRFIEVEDNFSSIENQMVTKAYLDDRLADIKADYNSRFRQITK